MERPDTAVFERIQRLAERRRALLRQLGELSGIDPERDRVVREYEHVIADLEAAWKERRIVLARYYADLGREAAHAAGRRVPRSRRHVLESVAASQPRTSNRGVLAGGLPGLAGRRAAGMRRRLA